MTDQDSKNSDLQETEEGMVFDRGSPLSIFSSDRYEDTIALVFALLIALGVYILVD